MIKWYILHVLQGCESLARTHAQEVIRLNPDLVFHVRCPTEIVVEQKGQKKVREDRILFPGYIFIKMKLTQVSFLDVLAIPGVVGFVGITTPKEVPQKWVEENNLEGSDEEVSKAKLALSVGLQVYINDGPLVGNIGIIETINEDETKVKVSVTVFGRSTLVEMDAHILEKV